MHKYRNSLYVNIDRTKPAHQSSFMKHYNRTERAEIDVKETREAEN